MKISIMQPYFLPYIGYWQLIDSADLFVIYDDVNFIKQGWINRNKIIVNGKPIYFTLNLKKASSFKKINEIEININPDKLLKTIYQAYCKYPFFEEGYSLIEDIFKIKTNNLSSFVYHSIIEVNEYLNIKTKIKISSDLKIGEKFKAQDRIIYMCNKLKADTYLNMIGGVNLYSYSDFNRAGLHLEFLSTKVDNLDRLSILDLIFRYSKFDLGHILKYKKGVIDGIWAI